MKKKIKYSNKFATDQKINSKDLKVIKDFLPSPDELFLKDEKVKIKKEKTTFKKVGLKLLKNSQIQLQPRNQFSINKYGLTMQMEMAKHSA